MNRIGRFLLAAVMVTGLAGCGLSGCETVSTDGMHGDYTLTEYRSSDGAIQGPPAYTGTATLTTDNRYSFDLNLAGATFQESGRFVVTTPWESVWLKLIPDVGTTGITFCSWQHGAKGVSLGIAIEGNPGFLSFQKR